MLKRILSLTVILGILLCCAALPAQARTYTPPRLVGDVDGDQNVDVIDATFLQRHLAGIAIPFEFDESAADADENGTADVIDVTHLQRWLIDLDQQLNISQPVYIWGDRSTMSPYEGEGSQDLIITRICMDHFFAVPYLPLPVMYRINGSISDHWCVGDHVTCTFNNTYADDYDRIEGDLLTIDESDFVPDPDVDYKPVIYLYPEQETQVNVTLDLNGEWLTSYPAYENGWTVTAAPDGTLTDDSGRTYPYLFWEARLNADYDLSKGFCVRGEDTESFLQEKLAVLGLSESEIADFTGFWLGFMERNPYNVITFQTDAYTEAAKLHITPQPDTVIRVFMAWYASDEAVDIPAQELTSAQRSGFTAVEWGGRMVR
ncbi:MAG: dockerin type I repeat-containing protein [Ruminococcus sp.]|nr:dockerin type I repeat-containing protein [Ruminococcus sp.]